MKILRVVLLAAGLVALIVVVLRIGSEAIVASLAQLAWWQLAALCVPYALVTLVDTLGWRYAFARDRVPFLRLLGARVAGEALNVVTALAAVGGEAVKAWLVRRDVSYEESVPAVIVAKTTITIAQALFLLLGIGVASATLSLESSVLRAMEGLLVLEVAAVGGFFLAQVTGLVARAGRLLGSFGLLDDPIYAERLDLALRRFYRDDWRRLTLSVGFHLVGWLLGALETFLMLVVLQVPAAPTTALVIEAFGTAVRFATFLVPASLGALEGANAAVFAALDLGAGPGLAFSFVRRARQAVWIAIGLVVLVVMRSEAWRERRSAA